VLILTTSSVAGSCCGGEGEEGVWASEILKSSTIVRPVVNNLVILKLPISNK
jgi:hypothetical protein